MAPCTTYKYRPRIRAVFSNMVGILGDVDCPDLARSCYLIRGQQFHIRVRVKFTATRLEASVAQLNGEIVLSSLLPSSSCFLLPLFQKCQPTVQFKTLRIGMDKMKVDHFVREFNGSENWARIVQLYYAP